MSLINLSAPLTPQNAKIVARANEVRERAAVVQASLENAPSDNVQLDEKNSNERLGIYEYKGSIGPEGYSNASVTITDGKFDGFVARDSKAGETIKTFSSTSKATGLRAAVAGAFGAIGGGLGNVAAYFFAKANTSSSDVVRYASVAAFHPFEFGSELANHIEHKISDPGTKDQIVALARPDGVYEQYVFTADGQLETNQS